MNVASAPANSTGLVFIGLPATTPVPLIGCLIQINPLTLTRFATMTIGATGQGSLQVPIPDLRAFANLDLMTQLVVGKGGFHLSNGLRLKVGY